MKSLVVSVCITAVTDMAAVSLLVFFWCSSGVLLGSSGFFWCSSVLSNTRRTPEEHQKERQKNPEEPRRRRTPAPPATRASEGHLLFRGYTPHATAASRWPAFSSIKLFIYPDTRNQELFIFIWLLPLPPPSSLLLSPSSSHSL